MARDQRPLGVKRPGGTVLTTATGLVLYATTIVIGTLAGAGPIVSSGPVDVAVRAGAAGLLALLMLVRPNRDVGMAALAYSSFLGLTGLLSVGAQLSQRLVPDGSGNYIIPNPVALTTTIVSTILLAIVAVASWRTLPRRSAADAARREPVQR